MKLSISGETYYVDFAHEPWRTTPHGTGQTWCSLYKKNDLDTPIANGKAYCGKKDNYSKRKGRKTSFQDLLEEMAIPREERGEWWMEYFKALPGDVNN
jgi:hypothetical protein